MTTLEIVLTASLVSSDAALVFAGYALHKLIRKAENEFHDRSLNLASYVDIAGAHTRDVLRQIADGLAGEIQVIRDNQTIVANGQIAVNEAHKATLNKLVAAHVESLALTHEALTDTLKKIDEGHAAGHQALLEAQKPLLDLNKSKAAAAKAQLQGGVYDAATRTIIRGGA